MHRTHGNYSISCSVQVKYLTLNVNDSQLARLMEWRMTACITTLTLDTKIAYPVKLQKPMGRAC